MKTISFAEINRLAAAHWQAEIERNRPEAVAVQAIETLSDALDHIADSQERAEILALLSDVVRPRIAELAHGV